MTIHVILGPFCAIRELPCDNVFEAHLREETVTSVSVVVPIHNELKSLAPLVTEVEKALGGRFDYQLLLVDDGSTDGSWDEICKLCAMHEPVLGLALPAHEGKTSALAAGFAKARSEIVVTMDGDLQDRADQIPSLIAKLEEGWDVVSGYKAQHADSPARGLASRLFNETVSRTTGLRLRDHNCGLKAYRTRVVRQIPIHGDWHRFFTVLAHVRGFRVTEFPVIHRRRLYGKSKYGFGRALAGIKDLIVILTLLRLKSPALTGADDAENPREAGANPYLRKATLQQ